MHALIQIITSCLVKYILISITFLWILCESRHLLGIGTRLGPIGDEELVHTYTKGMMPAGGVFKGYSDIEQDHFRRDKPAIPIEAWIFMIVVFFIFLALCIYFCVLCHIRRRRLGSNVNANTPLTTAQTSPPVQQEGVRTPVGANDVPPDYTVVVDQKPMAANASGRSNYYPKVVRGKKLETPPPAYMTVAPFK